MAAKKKAIPRRELLSAVEATRDHHEGRLTSKTTDVQPITVPRIDAKRRPRDARGAQDVVTCSAFKIDVNPRTLERWEQGHSKPNEQAAALTGWWGNTPTRSRGRSRWRPQAERDRRSRAYRKRAVENCDGRARMGMTKRGCRAQAIERVGGLRIALRDWLIWSALLEPSLRRSGSCCCAHALSYQPYVVLRRLWPTSILSLATAGNEHAGTRKILSLAIVSNMALYSLLGVVAWSVRRRFGR